MRWIAIIVFSIAQYTLGWLAGYNWKRYPRPEKYETDGSFLIAVYKDGTKENLGKLETGVK